jgi:hypothetical protein
MPDWIGVWRIDQPWGHRITVGNLKGDKMASTPG